MNAYLIPVYLLFLTLYGSSLKGQDDLKSKLLHKRWYLRQVVEDDKRVDVPEKSKAHYMLFKTKVVETIGPNGENYATPYSVDDRTSIVTIHEPERKMKIVSVTPTEMLFYFLDDPEKKTYVTKYAKPVD